MTRPVRIGFAGAGAVARRHMSLLEEVDDVEVVAVRDYDSEDPLLEGVAIDALFVCTPPAAHAAPTVAALRRGVHVYVEKPLARTLEDGAQMVEAWRESGAVCAVGYQWRALDFLDQMAELLHGRRLGLLVSRNVSAAEAGRVQQLRDAAPGELPWFADRQQSGGILFELGSHDIDLQLALGGPVTSVQATGGGVALAQAGAPETEVEDVLVLTLRFASGALGTIAVVWTGPDVPELFELDVFAESASMRVDLDPRFELSGEVDGEAVSLSAAVDPLRRSVARFLAAVRRGDPRLPLCTPADAYQTLEVALACERSLGEGSTPIEIRRSR
jgi:predicted dehydrogenase